MSSVSKPESTGNLHHLQDHQEEEEDEEEEEEEETRGAYNSYQYKSNGSSSNTWEIEEELGNISRKVNHTRLGSIKEESTEIISRSSSSSLLFSFDAHNNNNNNNNNNKGDGDDEDDEACVYVGIGNKDEQSSMDALSWTLNHIILPTSTVCLVHVFPEIHHIPSPLGKLPKSQVSPEQVKNYMAQETGKRRDFLQKFLNMCTASKVNVDTVLIESDMVAKAFLDLIPILNMRKLVLGTTKSSLRRSKTKRGIGLIDQIRENAPEYCEIKIICEGKEVNGPIINGSPSPRGAADYVGDNANSIPLPDQVRATATDSFACMCFKSPRVM